MKLFEPSSSFLCISPNSRCAVDDFITTLSAEVLSNPKGIVISRKTIPRMDYVESSTFHEENANGTMNEFVIRFFVGGIVVSLFAVIGDVVKPKSFAGLFGAAPSVALATLALTISKEGSRYAALEARSMMISALAFFVYASGVSWLMLRRNFGALPVTLSLLIVWGTFGFALWYVILR